MSTPPATSSGAASAHRASRAVAAAGDTHQYLTFTAAGETFGVGILMVKELIEYGSPTAIPMMPPYLRGVINLRGSVVPVIDLSARFGHGPSTIGRRSCIVIVEVTQSDGAHDLGIMVDTVSAVIEIPSADIEPAPSFGARIRADFIAGLGKAEGGFVILLDIERVLSADEMASLSRLSA